MRFDNEDRHQEKKLYANSDSLYDLDEEIANKLVNETTITFSTFNMLGSFHFRIIQQIIIA